MNEKHDEYLEIMNRLDRMDEKTEFFCSEVYQRYGRKAGFDIGLLYGIVFGSFLFICVLFFL